jgi:aspartyl-tRNA synthetase
MTERARGGPAGGEEPGRVEQGEDRRFGEELGTAGWKRTHSCGRLRADDVGGEAVLMGWVDRVRDHGGVLFVDLRDRYGVTQVVIRPEETSGTVRGLRAEDVVVAVGRVEARPESMVNREMETGEVELTAREVHVLNPSRVPPFPLADAPTVSEDRRLTYRYLDLRRPELQRNLRVRHQVTQAARRFLSDQAFLEIETPMLVKSTPEGARDYLVPSRVHPGRVFALPQSPQLYKQILMVAGVDRYFQMARCLRDEDLRADRQPEHTQIDLEMSFVSEEDVFELVEGLMVVVVEAAGREAPARPFPRLTYREAMERYGTDKPDLRFGMPLVDLTEPWVGHSSFRVAGTVAEKGGRFIGFRLPGGAALSRKDLSQLEEKARDLGAAGLLWLKVEEEGVSGPTSKFLSEEGTRLLLSATEAASGDLVLCSGGEPDLQREVMGRLRLDLGRGRLEPAAAAGFAFAWVRRFPIFERDEETGGWTATHHMFTMPDPEEIGLLESDPGRVHGQLYDLVCNGVELGSGSVRIHRREVQERVMQVMGIGHEEAEERFGFLLRAMEYGAPPHGGIALGLDRIVMLLVGAESLREVIAFPKTTIQASPMDGAPSPVDEKSLEELSLRQIAPRSGKKRT